MKRRPARRGVHRGQVALLAGLLSTTCDAAPRFQDALDPAGIQAAHIHDLWVLMLSVCTAVFIAVMVGLVFALRRSGRGDAGTPADVSSLTHPEPQLHRNVLISMVVTIVLLLLLLAASVFTDRALARMPLANPVRLDITAHQWWWEVRYMDDEPSRIFTTANELQIPVGRPVVAQLHADDVIHSLWIPNLHGKKDLIPGETSLIQFRADRPGTYRGQCAEFCGYQHAWMAFHVTAKPNAEYEQWADQQRQSAPAPSDPLAQRGLAVFLAGPCAMCHTIQGTMAHGQSAPDLTHVASRPSLAAGRLPNNAENLAAWIANPQQFKPGSNMPATGLPADDLRAVVAYLGTLK